MARNPVHYRSVPLEVPSKRKLAAMRIAKKNLEAEVPREDIPEEGYKAVEIPPQMEPTCGEGPRVGGLGTTTKGDISLTVYQRRRIREIAAEIYRRKNEALRLWVPMPEQRRFHLSEAGERIVIGSNRSGKAQPVDEKILTPTGWKSIGRIKVGNKVIGGDGKPCTVTGVFPQGEKEVFNVVFDDNASTRCCKEHLWKVLTPVSRFRKESSVYGKWRVMSLGSITDQWTANPNPQSRVATPACVAEFTEQKTPLDPYLIGVLIGDGGLTQGKVCVSTIDEEMLEFVSAAIPAECVLLHSDRCTYDIAIGSDLPLYRNPVATGLRELGLMGKKSYEKSIPKSYLINSVDVRLEVLRGIMDTDGTISEHGHAELSTTSPDLARDVEFLVRSLGGQCKTRWRTTHYTYLGVRRPGRPSARMSIRLPRFNPFRMERKASRYKPPKTTEHRLLHRVEPAGRELCVCISVDSPDRTYVTKDGIVTHNTTVCAVDFAWIVMGIHPTFSGKTVPKKDGRSAIVGFDWPHIGRVIYKKLFTPGAFKIIRDRVTGKWRPYRPATDEDRRSEAKPAPALIPKRAIKRIAWKCRALSQPKLIVLKNGWEINFYSSEGKPPQGDAIHIAWFDEEIQSSDWYTEFVMRLTDEGGIFVWSATPHVGGDDLINLHNRAIKQLTDKKPTVTEHVLTLANNRHISEVSKARVIEKFADDPEAYRVRVLGQFAGQALRVYSDYSYTVHGFYPEEVWKETGGQVPHDWCRYVAVDPGRQKCALLFMAVPPPKFGECWYAYKEVVLEKCNPKIFADAVEVATRDYTFEVFLMDMHAGRNRGTAGSKSVEEQYYEALKNCGPDNSINVWDRFREKFFWPGADDLDARIDEVRTALHIDPKSGKSRLQTAIGRLPNMEKEMERYQYPNKDGKIGKKPRDKWHDVLDCLGYLVTFRPTWQKPMPVPRAKSAAVLRFLEKKNRAMAERRQEVLNFGPGKTRQSAYA